MHQLDSIVRTSVKLLGMVSVIGLPNAALSQVAAQTPSAAIPITAVSYEVRFDSTTARSRTIVVSMSFTTAGPGHVLLSLPSWTPGAYELGNYARFVSAFSAASGADSLRWDKLDPDTWRVIVTRGGQSTVSFDYRADSLDNAMSWTRPDFAFFNGTNLFLYPETGTHDFVASVNVRTEPSWRIATGMTPGAAPRSFTAQTYHDLVDMPFFVGRFDIDSTRAAGKWLRFASYPAGSVSQALRTTILGQFQRFIPPQVAVFGEVPWDTYTVLQVADPDFSLGGAAGLEHQNSHLNIVSPAVINNPMLASLYAHEVFHAWNVKRMRPSEMTPYVYNRAQPTTLLWISEGVTDYYADLSEVRGKIITPRGFYSIVTRKIDDTADKPPTALEDASLSAWIHPVDGTDDIYYDKGSLAALLIDILIRDASDNRGSLDTVMRDLYGSTYKRGQGFTNEEWWAAVSRAAGGKSFAEFERRYVDGRDRFPYDSVLPLAGMRLLVERTVQPSLGISVSADEEGSRVMQVVVGGPGSTAGIKLGDYLLSIGGIDIADPAFAQKFNAKYAGAPPGSTIQVQIRRGAQRLTLTAPARFNTAEGRRVIEIPNAPAKAVRVRDGLLNGTTRP
ncbi:MAG TPA: PDZ domain-containing protein [Gemmatimonadaceae bacterium]|nr:PDZ domain-containing protein [Gemmatimonadaceae bacterium]